ncbi:MAG TPA: hypothetical protein PLI16_06585 [Bacteroidales bacterium]|jgi:hypothetical protein|nr:hypothetical protein [Bacteroidales bacterium]HNZ43606.1 hypothetical protein [Bacteroidales bacterium]HOH84264.1 hypothetical protein [Bacteroidales bacterium]HPB26369.1 hypothetical protein [Bacteroidales bacterium]HPI30958.1 hypothetical protein [Bacteroidales bacterium]
MRNILVVLMLSLLMVSCSQGPNEKGEYVIKPGGDAKEIHVKYNANGNLEYIQQYAGEKAEGIYLNFHDNQQPDNLTFIKEGKNHGTGLVFHKNGMLNNVGNYVDGERSGWFYVFDRNSVLTGKREYIVLDGKSYLNQWIEYDRNGLPDKMNSSYLNVKAPKDTIKNGEEFQLSVALEASFFKQYMLLIVGPFDEKYQLPANATCDTIKSNNYNALYKTKSYKKGKNVIRGMVQEIKLKDNESAYEVRKIYFSTEFFVSK